MVFYLQLLSNSLVSGKPFLTAVMGTSLSCLMMSRCTGMLGMLWTTICRQGVSDLTLRFSLAIRITASTGVEMSQKNSRNVFLFCGFIL